MQIARITSFLILAVIFLGGCNAELEDLKVRNARQNKLIEELRSELQTATLERDASQRQLDDLRGTGGIETDAMKQKIAALEEDIAKKNELIESMQQQLLTGGPALPAELNNMLADFAKGQEMITYDEARGIVKFKSDLLFDKGSDTVAASSMDAIKSLCAILNSEQAQNFDVIVAGHTDDLKISRPETKQLHPTNWHLSAHRAISVLETMTSNGIIPQRISVRGFSEFRPIADNVPSQGNQQNRRVEIYIVPKGA